MPEALTVEPSLAVQISPPGFCVPDFCNGLRRVKSAPNLPHIALPLKALEKVTDHRVYFGAAEGTRTPDPIITNDVLYQLSYSGTGFCGRQKSGGVRLNIAPEPRKWGSCALLRFRRRGAGGAGQFAKTVPVALGEAAQM